MEQEENDVRYLNKYIFGLKDEWKMSRDILI